jgi:hypothetical protein
VILALPPAPERKLLTGNSTEIDAVYVYSGRDFRLVERWYENGRYQRFVNGELVEDSHYHYRPPFVQFTFTGWREL